MRRIRHFIWNLTFALLILGCKEKELPTYYVSQEMLRYCWFPEGSYWIYEEDSTPGWFDSVYVSNPLHLIAPVEGDDFNSEGYSNDLVMSGLKFRQGSQAEPLNSTEGPSISYLSEFYSDSTGQVHDYLLFSSSNGTNQLPFHPSTSITGHLDSIVVHNKIYYDVIEITTSSNEAEFTILSLWAKDIGVLRRALKDGTSWSLVRYHING